MGQPNLPATFVSVDWRETPDGWAAHVLFATDDEYETVPLHPGTQIDWEVTMERSCIGYRGNDGELHPCPERATIQTGDQCNACRGRDAVTDYVEGRDASSRTGDHSVYLAQVGTTIKVGVTRSTRLLQRWVEQGASYGVELDRGLTAHAALERETELTETGLREAVRAEDSLPIPDTPGIRAVLDKLDLTPVGDVMDVFDRTIYPAPSCTSIVRTGPLTGGVSSVIGQVMAVDGVCLAVTGGRRVITPEQTTLTEY